MGERQSAALRTGISAGSRVAHPARVKTASKETMHRFIAAQGPVCDTINPAETLRADRENSLCTNMAIV
jgi:hypothetical protein